MCPVLFCGRQLTAKNAGRPSHYLAVVSGGFLGLGRWRSGRPRASRPPMIRLDNISKQNGHQILFIDASMGVLKGEKVGLVGPNGAGKTTLFRMITGQEQPDDGLVAIDPGMTIGYFSQDVGEMSGQGAVAAG